MELKKLFDRIGKSLPKPRNVVLAEAFMKHLSTYIDAKITLATLSPFTPVSAEKVLQDEFKEIEHKLYKCVEAIANS